MRIHAPAKVNLGLLVGPTDETAGLHSVDSLFHFTAFGDTVTLEAADKLSLTCDRNLGIADEDNLAYRAAVAMGDRFNFAPTVAIHIEKRIPHGAGFGGGSSDAAAVILGLATMHGIARNDEGLFEVARSLGADVAVFLAPEGAPIMTGFGDVYVRSAPAAIGLPVVLAQPEDSVLATADVYRAFDSMPHPPREFSPIIDAMDELMAEGHATAQDSAWDRGAIFRFGRRMFNTLQVPATRVCRDLSELNMFLADQRECLGAMVSGSGSGCFALCQTMADADAIVARAQRRGYWVVATTLAGHGAVIEQIDNDN